MVDVASRTNNTIDLVLTATDSWDLKINGRAQLAPGDIDAATIPAVGTAGPYIDVNWSNLKPNTNYTMHLTDVLDANNSPLLANSGSTPTGVFSAGICTCKPRFHLAFNCFDLTNFHKLHNEQTKPRLSNVQLCAGCLTSLKGRSFCSSAWWYWSWLSCGRRNYHIPS